MPTNLTDSSAFTDPVQVPTDGDPVGAGPGSYLRAALQALADRTRYLFNGVPRIRNVANTGALKAITGAVDGDVAILNGGQLYFYSAGATIGTDLAGYRYDSVITAGFWASPLYYITTGTPLRQDVSVLPPPNRIVQDFEVAINAPSSQSWSSGATWRSTSATITLTGLEVDDIVQLRSGLVWSVDTNTEVLDARIYVTAPGGASAVSGTLVESLGTPTNNMKHALALEGRYVVTDAGNHTFTAQVHGDGGGAFGFSVYGYRTLRGLVIRPLLTAEDARRASASIKLNAPWARGFPSLTSKPVGRCTAGAAAPFLIGNISRCLEALGRVWVGVDGANFQTSYRAYLASLGKFLAITCSAASSPCVGAGCACGIKLLVALVRSTLAVAFALLNALFIWPTPGSWLVASIDN